MLSIITNFGCDFRCPYCIWRNNSDNHSKYPVITSNPLNDTEFKKLLLENKTDVISLSGGGDPLYRFSEQNSVSRQFLNDLDKMNIKYDIHSMNTKELINAINTYNNIHKVVVHIRLKQLNLDYIKLIEIAKSKNVQVRFALVLDGVSDTDIAMLEEIFRDVQFSLRRHVTKDGISEVSDYAKTINERNPLHMFIEQKDYNTYLMPDNTITTEFLG